jgi:WD40 repeat protein
MPIQSIENILKLIFYSQNKSDLTNLLSTIKCKTLFLSLLKVFGESIFHLIRKSNTFLKGHEDTIFSILGLPNGNIISASRDDTFKIWNLKSNECIRTIEEPNLRLMTALPNGTFASCSYDGQIKVWKYADQDLLCIQKLYIEGYAYFSKLAALSNNNLVCSAFRGNDHIIILDYGDEYKISSCLKQDEVDCLACLDGGEFASGSGDHIKLWDTGMKPCNYKCLTGHTSSVYCLMFSSKYKLLYSGANDHFIMIWDYNAGYECIKTIEAHNNSITRLILLPNGFFASGSSDNYIKFWDRNNNCVNRLFGGKNYISSLLFLKNYRIISASSEEHIIKIYGY